MHFHSRKCMWKYRLRNDGNFVSASMCFNYSEQHINCCVITAVILSSRFVHNAAANTLFWVNTLRPRQDGRHFPDDIFKWILLNENVWISINISLKFVPRGPINNIPTLVQVMAWRRPGDKPLSEPMMVRLPTHICVTRPQWVNLQQFCWQSQHE